MKNFLIGVLVGIAVPITGAFSYLRLGMAEVRADIPPGRWENYLMNTGMHASVQREASNAPNPVLPTDENVIAGGKLYLSACAGCPIADKVKSLWPNYRLVIALHSPSGIGETGLRVCPAEKKALKPGCGIKTDAFSGPVCA